MDHPDDPDRRLDLLAADWIALWESELAALGQDAELAEAWSASVALMAAFWRAQTAQMAAAMKWRAHEPEAPPRPAPAAAAPDAGRLPRDGGAHDAAAGGGPSNSDGAALRARLAELEQRLATLEGGAAGGGADRGRARKPRPRKRS